MPTPREVQRAAKAADAIHAKVYAQVAEEAEDVVAGTDDQQAPPAEETPPTSAAEPTNPPAEPTEAGTDDGSEPTEQKKAAPAEPPAEQDPLKKLEADYRAQLGRNDALRNEIQDLRNVIAAMQVPASAPPEVNPQTLITQEEIEEYGEDLIGIIRRATQEATGPLTQQVDHLMKVNAQLQERMGGVSQGMANAAREAVYRALDEWNPQWEAINNDKAFKQWLALPDVFSGQSRNAMLNAAFEANDARRVVAFFDAFVSETQSVSPQADGTPAQATGRQPQVQLGDLAAPGRSRGGPEGSSQEGKVWSQRAIAQFYSDVAKGKYKGREKEQRSIEKDIVAAINTPGRLVP